MLVTLEPGTIVPGDPDPTPGPPDPCPDPGPPDPCPGPPDPCPGPGGPFPGGPDSSTHAHSSNPPFWPPCPPGPPGPLPGPPDPVPGPSVPPPAVVTETLENFTVPFLAAIVMLIEYSAPEDLDFTAAFTTFSAFFAPAHLPVDFFRSTAFPLNTRLNLHFGFCFPITASNLSGFG